MISLVLILATLLALLSILRARVLLRRLTLRIPSQIDNITFLNTLVAVALVVLAVGNHYLLDRQDEQLAELETRLAVLEDLADLRTRMLEDYLLLLGHSLVLNNYSQYERARSANTGDRPPWEEVVNQQTLGQLNQAWAAFSDLQGLARQVLDWTEGHPDLLPAALVEWARFTAKLDPKDLSRHIQVLDPSPESLTYRSLLAQALSAVAITGG